MFSAESKLTNWNLRGFNNVPAQIFQSIESTHLYMKGAAIRGLIQPGTLIVADQQSCGHGRHDRTWASPAGKNLYFNILIPLEGIPQNRFAQITQVAALTFAEVFRSLQKEQSQNTAQATGIEQAPQITVKWPNDILYGKSKFCGILAEIVFAPAKSGSLGGESGGDISSKPVPALNMGVGINVNGNASDYAFLNRSVTTLKEIIGCKINREKLLQALVASLERAIGQFKAFGLSPWVEAWRKMDQFIGARGTIIVNNHCTDENRERHDNSAAHEGVTKKSGCILDMQPDGSLLFKTDDGEIQTVYSADLEI